MGVLVSEITVRVAEGRATPDAVLAGDDAAAVYHTLEPSHEDELRRSLLAQMAEGWEHWLKGDEG